MTMVELFAAICGKYPEETTRQEDRKKYEFSDEERAALMRAGKVYAARHNGKEN